MYPQKIVTDRTTIKRVTFNNTVLRDALHSLAANRMTMDQMLPAAAIHDGMGFGGLETWGGATIDACLRYLGENPFDRLRALKQAAPRTPQIMQLRGQNIVQYTSFPDEVVSAFIRGGGSGCPPDHRRPQRHPQPRHRGEDRDRMRKGRAAKSATPTVRCAPSRVSSQWAWSWRAWAVIRSGSRTCTAS